MTVVGSLRDQRMGHIPALDGVRGLAVLAVVAHHLDHLAGGYLGVDAFFVLSGFLITGLLVDEVRLGGSGRVDLGRFWMRRVKRLFPALLLLLVTVVIVESFVVSGTPTLRREVLSSLFYAYNWTALVDGVDYWSNLAAPSPLRHMWSLAIEEQFYVVWPLVVTATFAVVARSTRRATGWTGRGTSAVGWVAFVGAVASVLIAQLVHDPQNLLRVYYGTDTRVASILFGATAAIVVRKVGPLSALAQRALGAIAAALVVVTAWAWVALDGTSPVLYRGGLAGAGLAVTVIVATVVVAPRSLVARAAALAPLRWCGLVSYGLYLWHWPIIVWLTPARVGVDGLALDALRLLLTLAVTLASYFWLEQPIRRSTIAARPTALVGAAAISVLAVFTLVASSGAAARIEQPAAGTRSTVPIPPPPAPTSAPTTAAPPGSAPETTTDDGATAPPERLLVVGDSGAFFLGEELLATAPADTIVVPRGVVGCGIASAGGGVYTTDGSFLADPDGCASWPDAWATDVDAFRPDHVLIVLSWPGIGEREVDGVRVQPCDPAFDAYYEGQLRTAIDTASSRGAEVVVATAPYYVGADGGAVEPERIDCLNELMRSASAARGATVLDLASWTCPEPRQCRVTADGATLRPDGLHFAGDGGRIAAAWIFDQLSAAS